MTGKQAIASIQARGKHRDVPGLDYMERLCDRLGHPERDLKFIHVAGTNGKGSTCAMLASVLQKAGYRVGLFTSPYMITFHERMSVDGRMITDEELAEVAQTVFDACEGLPGTPTEFELITAISLIWFSRKQTDLVVFEVGLGGRLDPTNVIPRDSVLVDVITGIAMDHTAILGDTVEKIASEKAGIIKPGVPVVFGGNHPPVGLIKDNGDTDAGKRAADVIRNRADTSGSPYVETAPDSLTVERSDIDGLTVSYKEYAHLRVSLPGIYQAFNTATVLDVLRVLKESGMRISDSTIRDGLADVRWIGRFDVLRKKPMIISDGGHNPEGVAAATGSYTRLFPDRKCIVISGVMQDKDYVSIAEEISSVACCVLTVTPDNTRSLNGVAYARLFAQKQIETRDFTSMDGALACAINLSAESGYRLPILTLGSLYMYSDLVASVNRLLPCDCV